MKEKDIRNREILNEYQRLVAQEAAEMFKGEKGFSRIACPACGKEKNVPQFKKIGFSYVTCPDCGTLFVNPRPSLEALKSFYMNSKSWDYYEKVFFQPFIEARREKIFVPRAQYIKETLPDLSRGLIGDVGAGYGIFVEELARLWPQARLIAIEPSGNMIKLCKQKGMETIHAAIEDVTGWNGKFDLLTAFELIEHLYDPGLFLEVAGKLLKPGGYLHFTTLNGEGFDIQILWEKAKCVYPPHHLNFFNPASIRKLLEAKDFEVVKLETPGKLDWDIVESMQKEEGFDPGRFWKLVNRKGSSEVKQKLQYWIAESGLSSHMKVLARKVK